MSTERVSGEMFSHLWDCLGDWPPDYQGLVFNDWHQAREAEARCERELQAACGFAMAVGMAMRGVYLDGYADGVRNLADNVWGPRP